MGRRRRERWKEQRGIRLIAARLLHRELHLPPAILSSFSLSLSLSLVREEEREREAGEKKERERERALGRGSAFGWRVHLRKMAAVARFAPRWILFSFSNEREREREGERSTCSKRDLDVSAHLQRNLHSLQQYRSRDIWIDSNIMDDFESVV